MFPQLAQRGQKLLERLSFSHSAKLIAIHDPLKCTFYEIESVRGNWSVRELKRQITSLHYEHSGLSENKGKRGWAMGVNGSLRCTESWYR